MALIVTAYFYFTTPAPIYDSSIAEDRPSHSNESIDAIQPEANQANFPPRKQQIAWTEITLDNSLPTSKWAHVPEHARFVNLNDRFNQWLLRTPIEIHIPHINKTYNAVVDQITPNGLESTTIRASPATGEQDLNRFILTFGEEQTLAYVSTNQGSWELTGDGRIGWLVSSTDLRRSQDYSKSDVLNESYDRYAEAEYVPRRND